MQSIMKINLMRCDFTGFIHYVWNMDEAFTFKNEIKEENF